MPSVEAASVSEIQIQEKSELTFEGNVVTWKELNKKFQKDKILVIFLFPKFIL